MLHASTRKLIVKIAELTETGAIAWKEGEGARPCSVFESEGYLIEVTADPPTLRVMQADGREIERADATDLAGEQWPGGGGTFAAQVAAMAERAHRVARGAEAAISRILSSLSAPPQRAPEPEPFPAAPEFEATTPARPVVASHAIESEAALAAISADMDSMRKPAPPEPLPQSHSEPEEAPAPAPHRPLGLSALLRSTAAPAPRPSPPLESQRPVSAPAPSPGQQPRPAFGETISFNRAPSTPAAQAEASGPAKVTSGGLLITGISAVTRQTIRGESAPEPPRPAPTPEPKAEPLRQPATGPGVYKPWA
jgi:hypothetical protein